tara:strand:- start:9474 stop:10346 length:873 start_codon:yes stop_codon:yes gene_type:complete
MFTLLIMSFHSSHLIYNLVKSIDTNIPIVIVENSQNYDLKKNLESEYKNVKVIIPSENLGFAKGANLGIKEIKTEYIFLNPADVFLPKKCIDDLIQCIKEFDDFAMLAPTYKDESVYKNYELYSSKPKLQNDTAKKFLIKEVDIIDGTFIIKKSKFDKIGFFDENIFIYFEPWDLSKRVINSGEKLYVCDKIKFEHLGGQSHEPKFNYEATLSRNWHYCWSKFYYLRKYSNYINAMRKTLPILIRALSKSIKYKFFNDKKLYKIHMAEVRGLISAYFLKKSTYRPYDLQK